MTIKPNPLSPRGITPTPSCIGGRVVYRTAPDYKAEEGVITSYNDACIFVRYGNDVNSKATSRRDLDWTYERTKEVGDA